MTPVDNNTGVRTQRSDLDQGTRRSEGGANVDRSQAPAPGQVDGANAATGESVSFTQTASDLLSLETQLRELPGIDQARVDSIREAIENGSFEIDTDRIVDNLLRTEAEFGGS